MPREDHNSDQLDGATRAVEAFFPLCSPCFSVIVMGILCSLFFCNKFFKRGVLYVRLFERAWGVVTRNSALVWVLEFA